MISTLRKHHFLLRRLHSLTGIVPVGGYLLIHLYTNSRALQGAEAFHAAVRAINALPGVHLMEIFLIILPLYFHGFYGIYIALQARHNLTNYGHGRNWAFFWQRVTGIITLLCVTWHLWLFRFQKLIGAYGPYEGGTSMSGLPTYEIVHAAFSNPWVAGATAVGTVAAAYHLCNGVYTFLITWGITIGPRSQRAAGFLTSAAFAAVSLFGLAALYAFL